ncbi:MAG TPA: hypothetical protein VHR38_13425 [Solirubrobacterales bacterium]|jgi:hypothetical protein|nr:hypothetical protein [Solirubrobacterales bacterium]
MAGEWGDLALESKFKAIDDRLRRIEADIKRICETEGIPWEDPNAEVPDEVFQLAAEGKTLEAIAAYRKATGAPLERAREVVFGI